MIINVHYTTDSQPTPSMRVLIAFEDRRYLYRDVLVKAIFYVFALLAVVVVLAIVRAMYFLVRRWL